MLTDRQTDRQTNKGTRAKTYFTDVAVNNTMRETAERIPVISAAEHLDTLDELN